MAITIPRFRILPLRGTYAALLAEIDEINDNEICYAIDQDQYYQKEGSVLVQVGATKDQGAKADSAVQPVDLGATAFSNSFQDLDDVPNLLEVGDNISLLANNVNYVTQLQGASLYATAAQGAQASTAIQPGDNVSELVNDAGYVTDAGVTQIIAGTNVTISPTGGTGAVTVNATGGGGGVTSIIAGSGISVDQATGDVTVTATGGGGSVWSQNGNTAYYNTGTVSVGTDSPSAADAFHVRGSVAPGFNYPVQRFSYNAASVPLFDPVGQISFSDNTNATAAAIVVRNNEGTWSGGNFTTDIEFYACPQFGSSALERFTITGDGEVYVGAYNSKKVKVTDDGKVVLNTAFLPIYSDPSAAIIGGEEEGTVCVAGNGFLFIAKVIG